MGTTQLRASQRSGKRTEEPQGEPLRERNRHFKMTETIGTRYIKIRSPLLIANVILIFFGG